MREKLLIVDDEPGIVEMMASYFAPQYQVLTARSGAEALEKAGEIKGLTQNLPTTFPYRASNRLSCMDFTSVTFPSLSATKRIYSPSPFSAFVPAHPPGTDFQLFSVSACGPDPTSSSRQIQSHPPQATPGPQSKTPVLQRACGV